MEKMTIGLALEELEAQHVELLPDRIEMRRANKTVRRIRRQNINCAQDAIAPTVGVVAINGAQQCFITNA